MDNYLGIVLIQEMNKPNIVVEGDCVRLGKSAQVRQVGRGSVQRTKEVLAKTDGFELSKSAFAFNMRGIPTLK